LLEDSYVVFVTRNNDADIPKKDLICKLEQFITKIKGETTDA